MGTRSALPDLEVLSLDDVRHAETPTRSRWPWMLVILALLVAGAGVWGVRSWALSARCRGLRSAWSEASELDRLRAEQLATMRALAGPQDDDRARRASARLDEEEARRLLATHPARIAPWSRDGALDHLGQTMAAYFDGRADELRRAAVALQAGDPGPELPAPTSPQTAAQRASIDELLARQVARFHLPPTARPRVNLTAARADLAVLRTFAREPTGSRLLAGTDGGMVELDVDTSRAIPLPLIGIETAQPPLFEPARVLRAGSVAFVVAYYGAPGVAYARPLAPSGDVSRLGLADGLVPAGPADAVWLWKGSTATSATDPTSPPTGPTITEVRVTDGAVLAGPTTLPAGATVVGRVAGSLLLRTGDSRIVRLDPATGWQADLGSETFTFAAPDGSLMWVTGAGPVHLIEPDGRQLTTQLPDRLGESVGPAAWSPDRRNLAAFFSQPDGSWQLRLVDLETGVASVVAGATSGRAPASVLWSADGTRVFWLDSHARQGLATYRLGAARAEVLRVGTLDIESIVLLP